MRVFDRIVQRLQRNTVEFLFDGEWQIWLWTQIFVHFYILPRLQRCRLFGERGHQPFGL